MALYLKSGNKKWKVDTGFVYVCENPSMPGLLKIGKCKRHPKYRMRDLYTAAVPTPFKLVWFTETEFASNLETSLHHVFGERGDEGLSLNVTRRGEWYKHGDIGKTDFMDIVFDEHRKFEKYMAPLTRKIQEHREKSA